MVVQHIYVSFDDNRLFPRSGILHSFNKPFVFCGNEKRGNMRLRSLYKMFMIDSEQTEHLDWQAINRKIEQFRRVSEDFLNHSLRAE